MAELAAGPVLADARRVGPAGGGFASHAEVAKAAAADLTEGGSFAILHSDCHRFRHGF